MSFKKCLILCICFFSFITAAFAGVEDWQGTFIVKPNNKKFLLNVTHTPENIQLTVTNQNNNSSTTISSGKCIIVGNGSNIGGINVTTNIKLCVSMNVDNFTTELKKLGYVDYKSVELGPTYVPS
ncbi:MAG: hypothetical protein AB7F64_03500 [Gammaproteobacteria bacterium]